MSDEARATAGKAGSIADINNRRAVEALLDSAGIELAVARLDHEVVARLAQAWNVHITEARARLMAWAEALETGRASD